MNAPASKNTIQPHLAARQATVRKALAAKGLEGILLTHPGDLAYLTDFTGHDSIGALTADDFILVTDFRYTEQAQIESPWLKAIMREGKMSDALIQAFDQLKVTRYGFEASFTTYGQIDNTRKAIAEKNLPYTLEPLDDLMVNIRKVKDDVEIAIIKDAVKVAQEAMLALKPHMKPGVTENELAGRLVFEMRKRGASDASFEPIIATGAASSLPHYRPGDIAVRNDTFLLTDWGARYQGYCSDITRTWAIGKIPEKLKEIYAVCLEAQLVAIAAIKPGVTNKSVDAVARGIIDKAGHRPRYPRTADAPQDRFGRSAQAGDDCHRRAGDLSARCRRGSYRRRRADHDDGT
jgi:Xaa-Pro aminopeptidase